MRPRLLDLFCGAGGAAMGYYRAGFDVVGVDINPQPHYPFEFHQADALEFPLAGFDVFHASPPCQRYSWCTPKGVKEFHPDLIAPTRERIAAAGKPYVIENVKGARRQLRQPVMLCGTMFGLPLQRHRYFELGNVPELFFLIPDCAHESEPVIITGTHRRAGVHRFEYRVAECRRAAGIDWMTRRELDQAIPPAFTEFLGAQLMRTLEHQAVA